MQKINFQNLPNTTTPVNATNMNALQTNVEDVFNGNVAAGNMVVDSIRSKNMLNPSASISGAIANNSTSEATDGSTSAITSGWIPCKPNTSYTLSGNYNRIRWQSKAENNTITFVGENLTTITTNSTAKWIRVYFYYNSGGAINPTSITDIQVEEGSTATTYAPYQELDNIGCKYFYNGYLTAEQTIGTTYTNIDNINNKTITTHGKPLLVTVTLPLQLTANGTGSIWLFIDGNRYDANRIITANGTTTQLHTGQIIAEGIPAGSHVFSIRGRSDNSSYDLKVKMTTTVSLSIIEL